MERMMNLLGKPQYWSFPLRCIAGAMVCVAVLLYALYTQYFGGLTPCPLCTFQRGAFILLGLFFFCAALHQPRSRRVRTGYMLAVWLSAAAGMAIAARHVWLQLLPADQVPACGPDLGYMLQAWPLGDTLRQVFTGSGECAVIDWSLFGLSMPAWSLLTYLVLALWAVFCLRAPGSARAAHIR